jgi:hypothetical protein
MTEANHQYQRTGKAPARAQQQQGPPCLTTRHRHTLSRAGRRAYGDGETTAGLEHAGASINKHDPQSTGTRKQATTQSATFMQRTPWKPFSLDKLLQERVTSSCARKLRHMCHRNDEAVGTPPAPLQYQSDDTPKPPPVCQNCARNGPVRDYSGVRHRCGHERNDRAGSVRLSTLSSVLVFRTGRNHGLVLCHAAHGRGVRAGRPDQGRLCHHRRRSVCIALRASREKRMRSCPVASARGSGRLVEQSRRSRAGRPRLGA